MTTNDPNADAVLKEAEAIFSAESEIMHTIHEEVEAKVTELQHIACISHEDAHTAYSLFFRSMMASSKHAGVSLEKFMAKQSDDRTKLWMGMIIGSMPTDTVMVFTFPSGHFDD